MNQEVNSFLEDVRRQVTRSLNFEDECELRLIAQEHIENLTTIRSGYFRIDDIPKMSIQAAKMLSQKLNEQSTINLKGAWQEVVRDFHENQYWGYIVLKEKQKIPKKKNEFASFLWTLFQAAVVMKFIVLYFGINAAERDDDAYYWGLAAAIFVSFASLLYFAWRKSKSYKD